MLSFYINLLVSRRLKRPCLLLERIKTPKLDDFGSYFFQKSWDIVEADITRVVQDFFSNGKLLK